MVISVTAPKKGMGQTQSAINLSAMLTKLINGKVLLGDINKFSKDIEYYFSDTHALKGLDSLISLIEAGLLREDNFDTCVKSINSELDILIANECFELNNDIIDTLICFSEKLYEAVVFDTISGISPLTRRFFERSDVIVVVLNQYKNIVDLAIGNQLYKEFSHKVVYALNRYRDSINIKTSDVREILKSNGLDGEVFTISYDVSMINECNDRSVLNFILNKSIKTASVHEETLLLSEFLLKKHGAGIPLKDLGTKKGKLFPFFLSGK
jgi:cellulose biosynthesis protein BcsQ